MGRLRGRLYSILTLLRPLWRLELRRASNDVLLGVECLDREALGRFLWRAGRKNRRHVRSTRVGPTYTPGPLAISLGKLIPCHVPIRALIRITFAHLSLIATGGRASTHEPRTLDERRRCHLCHEVAVYVKQCVGHCTLTGSDPSRRRTSLPWALPSPSHPRLTPATTGRRLHRRNHALSTPARCSVGSSTRRAARPLRAPR